jgi:hypothetical protein
MIFRSLLFKWADVHCEQCQKKFKPEDFHAGEVLVCSSCSHQMPIQIRSDNAAHIEFDKNLVPPSDQVHLQRQGSISIIEKRWRSKRTKWIASLAFLWNLLWISGSLALYFSGWEPSDTIVLQALVPILIGLWLFKRSLQGLLNTTTIMIKDDKVVVGTAPIAWGPVRIYHRDEIASFSIWKIQKKNDKSHLVFSFGVDLNTTDGRHEKICLAGDVNEAIYIEKTIEELLAVEDGRTAVVDPDSFAV